MQNEKKKARDVLHFCVDFEVITCLFNKLKELDNFLFIPILLGLHIECQYVPFHFNSHIFLNIQILCLAN